MTDAFDLARFAGPEDVTFKLRKHGEHVFRVDADPDVDQVARMLRIENVLRGNEEGLDEALVEGKQLLLRLIREKQPEIEELRIGAQELAVVFTLIMHGRTVADAVVEAITARSAREAADALTGERHDLEDDEHAYTDLPRDPLGSAKPSSERSSGSDSVEAGLQAIGTA